jgi:chemotaxis protein histidine kinase CheA
LERDRLDSEIVELQQWPADQELLASIFRTIHTLKGTCPTMNLAVRTEEGAVSLLADEIGDVLQLKSADFESAPDNMTRAARELVRVIYKLKDGMSLVLAPDQTLDPRSRPIGSTALLEHRPGAAMKSPHEADRLLPEPRRMAEQQSPGKMLVHIEPGSSRGAERDIALAASGVIESLYDVGRRVTRCIDGLAAGDLDAELEQTRGEKGPLHDAAERLRDSLKTFIAEMHRISNEPNRGDIDVVSPADKFTGDFRATAQSINGMVTGHISAKGKSSGLRGQVHQGHFRHTTGTLPRQEGIHP